MQGSRSGFYAYARRQATRTIDRAKWELLARVKAIAWETRQSYGSRRMAIHVEERDGDRHREHAEHQREPGERADLVDALDDDQRADDDEQGEQRGVLVHVAPRHPIGGEPARHDRDQVRREPRDGDRSGDLPEPSRLKARKTK